jgi:hypothetical protein
VKVTDRVGATIDAGDIDDVEEKAGAFNVPKELEAETGAIAGTFDETGDIRQDETVVGKPNYAKVWFKGRERIGRDFWSGGGNCSKEGRLPGVRVAHQSDVCNDPEFKGYLALLPGFASLGEFGCLVRGGLEMRVAKSAPATTRDQDALLRFGDIAKEFPVGGIVHDSAEGNSDDRVLSGAPVAVTPSASGAVRCDEVSLEPEGDECVLVRVTLEVDAASTPTVATVWTAERDVLFPAHVHGAVATVPGFQADRCVVVKHGASVRRGLRPRKGYTPRPGNGRASRKGIVR